jgi:hypothetical protein
MAGKSDVSRHWGLRLYTLTMAAVFALIIWVVDPPGAPRYVYIGVGAAAAVARLVLNARVRQRRS